jgi:hypothetical protein
MVGQGVTDELPHAFENTKGYKKNKHRGTKNPRKLLANLYKDSSDILAVTGFHPPFQKGVVRVLSSGVGTLHPKPDL